jgi:glycosyltransferase involved in cell wall biosynthesis
VIENGVEFDWPIQTPEEKSKARDKLGLLPTVGHLVAVGGLRGSSLTQAAKGFDTLIRAWLAARPELLGAQLHIVGDGNLRSELEKLACSDPTVHFHGVQARVRDWLLAADAFVMPSRYEGLPIAGIEAIGTGLPCVFTEIQPLQLLGAPVAYWCGVDDINGLGQCIRSVLRERPSVDPVITQRIRMRFGIEGVASQYVAYYELLKTGRMDGTAH